MCMCMCTHVRACVYITHKKFIYVAHNIFKWFKAVGSSSEQLEVVGSGCEQLKLAFTILERLQAVENDWK